MFLSQQCRCWIGSEFLKVHGKSGGTRYEISRMNTKLFEVEAPVPGFPDYIMAVFGLSNDHDLYEVRGFLEVMKQGTAPLAEPTLYYKLEYGVEIEVVDVFMNIDSTELIVVLQHTPSLHSYVSKLCVAPTGTCGRDESSNDWEPAEILTYKMQWAEGNNVPIVLAKYLPS